MYARSFASAARRCDNLSLEQLSQSKQASKQTNLALHLNPWTLLDLQAMFQTEEPMNICVCKSNLVKSSLVRCRMI